MKLNNFIILAGLILALAILTSLTLPVTSASLGTFKQGTNVELIQTCNNCTWCNITSVKYPNSSNILTNQIMTKDGTYFNFTLNVTFTDTLGWHKYCYDCGNSDERATGCIDFNINLEGNVLEDGQGYILFGIFFIVFGIAWMFLYLSSRMAGEGLKIFFLLAAFVFLIGSMGVVFIIVRDYGLTSSMSSITLALLYTISLITVVMFFYVMIRQTVKALNLLNVNKGYASFHEDIG